MGNILTVREGPVLRIQLHRPERKNAITAEMYHGIASALAEGDADPAVRVMLLHGTDDAFTAGNDLGDFLANPPRTEDSHVMRFLQAISHTVKPLVGAVAGPAVGVGTTMLLHCDLVYAADDAKFALPFVGLGLCPEAASSFLLPRVAGYQRAAELLMLGEPFDAAKAREAGFVNQIVPRAELMAAATGAARKLAALPAASLRITKALMKRPLMTDIERALKEEIALFTAQLESPEAKEAFTAFFEKRRPDFSRFN